MGHKNLIQLGDDTERLALFLYFDSVVKCNFFIILNFV